MAEEKIKNSFIGTSFENKNFFIDSINLNTNIINREFIFNFISKNENYIESEPYSGFCFDCKKNIKVGACLNHNIRIYKDLIDNLNIKQIENNFQKVFENYNYIINKLEQKIKDLKQRNEEQIKLSQKIIEVYKQSLNSNKMTYQLLLNTQNILQFNDNINNTDLFENNLNIFDYNILKTYSIENYIKENIIIQKVQTISRVSFKEEIKSFLFLEKMDKFIFYSYFYLFLFNAKNFSFQHQIKINTEIFSLQLMKDKETLLLSEEKSIKRVKIENNILIIEEFINNINLYPPGKIFDYKGDIAWAYLSNIYMHYNNKEINVFEENGEFFLGKKQMIIINSLFEYSDDILLYIYIFTDEIDNFLHFNYLKEEKLNSCKDIIVKIDYKDDPDEIFDCFQIYKYRKNEIIFTSQNQIFMINIVEMEIIKIIEPFETEENLIIYNSYFLNNEYFLVFLQKDSSFYSKKCLTKNLVIYKFKEEYNNIIFEGNLNTEKQSDSKYYLIKGMPINNSSQFISINGKEIIFNDIIINLNKALCLQNYDA